MRLAGIRRSRWCVRLCPFFSFFSLCSHPSPFYFHSGTPSADTRLIASSGSAKRGPSFFFFCSVLFFGRGGTLTSGRAGTADALHRQTENWGRQKNSEAKDQQGQKQKKMGPAERGRRAGKKTTKQEQDNKTTRNSQETTGGNTELCIFFTTPTAWMHFVQE